MPYVPEPVPLYHLCVTEPRPGSYISIRQRSAKGGVRVQVGRWDGVERSAEGNPIVRTRLGKRVQGLIWTTVGVSEEPIGHSEGVSG